MKKHKNMLSTIILGECNVTIKKNGRAILGCIGKITCVYNSKGEGTLEKITISEFSEVVLVTNNTLFNKVHRFI